MQEKKDQGQNFPKTGTGTGDVGKQGGEIGKQGGQGGAQGDWQKDKDKTGQPGGTPR